jgi:hypothetical protein
MVEVAQPGVVIVEAAPDTWVHRPVPFTGVFPAKVAVVTLHKLWFTPALDTVGVGEMIIVSVEDEDAQLPLEMVHWNT